jgi:hypothetical protein
MDENAVFEEGVRCWVCPDCGFAFDATHTNTDGTGYSCPVCEITALQEDLAQRLFAEAEIARTSFQGVHPRISTRTHAAALRFAGDLVRTNDA